MKRQYVAIDLHRRHSLIVRDDDQGNQLGGTKIENDPLTLAKVVAEAGEAPEVAIEATNGWYWARRRPPGTRRQGPSGAP